MGHELQACSSVYRYGTESLLPKRIDAKYLQEYPLYCSLICGFSGEKRKRFSKSSSYTFSIIKKNLILIGIMRIFTHQVFPCIGPLSSHPPPSPGRLQSTAGSHDRLYPPAAWPWPPLGAAGCCPPAPAPAPTRWPTTAPPRWLLVAFADSG